MAEFFRENPEFVKLRSMPFMFFKIRVNDDGGEAQRLNAFLSAHRVLSMRNKWVADGEKSFWAFCVDYLEPGKHQGSGPPPGNAQRIDYREVLSTDEFAVFAKLRTLRKQLAEKDGVPVFTVFTNEHLAERVRRRCKTLADLKPQK